MAKINNILLMVFLLLTIMNCHKIKSQDILVDNDSLHGGDSLKIKIDANYTYEQFKSSIIQPYLDSLNAFRIGDKIPQFLWDKDLDLNSTINDWPNSNFVSLKEEIFKRVNNRLLLDAITKNQYFKSMNQNDSSSTKDKTTLYGTSIYRLAEERLKLLEK